MSENALSPLAADYSLTTIHLQEGANFSNRYRVFQNSLPALNCQQWSNVTSNWLFEELSRMGYRPVMQLFKRSEYSDHNSRNVSLGWNVFTTVRSSRADGTEALFLSSKYERISGEYQIDALGYTIAIMKQISDMEWLSRDYHFVWTPECHGDVAFIRWMDEYHNGHEQEFFWENSRDMFRFSRNTIIAGIHLEISVESVMNSEFDTLTIKPHGFMGHLPNLDLINTVARVSSSVSNIDFGPLVALPTYLESRVPFQIRTLLSFMKQQAMDVPEGNHGIDGKYNIDSITLRFHGRGNLKLGLISRIMDGTLRSLNNIQEHLHQSFYYYLLPSSKTYVPIGHYMIPFACVSSILLPWVFRLVTAKKWELLYSATMVCVTQIVGVIAFTFPWVLELAMLLVPSSLRDHVLSHNSYVVGIWVTLMIPTVFVLFRTFWKFTKIFWKDEDETEELNQVLQSTSLLPFIIYLVTQSLYNFSFTFFVLIFVAPFYVIPIGGRGWNFFLRVRMILFIFINPLTWVLVGLLFHFLSSFQIFSFDFCGFEGLLRVVVDSFGDDLKGRSRHVTRFFPFFMLIVLPLNFLQIFILACTRTRVGDVKHKLE
eukprot:TRINITY_DN9715_c0_g1_i4.p1 TRINITY_DN9715_c0_g1~~TRINITY_DN9715_c0_g1_i4.p1  ORF type:complete len:651 (-),score=100.89 TRINITY_DN9715_c0_g1_i4:45-1838(-)